MRPFGLSINVQRPRPRWNACPVVPPTPVAGVIALLMLIPMQSHVLIILEPVASVDDTRLPGAVKIKFRVSAAGVWQVFLGCA